MDYAISHHTVFMPAGEYIRKYRDETYELYGVKYEVK